MLPKDGIGKEVRERTGLGGQWAVIAGELDYLIISIRFSTILLNESVNQNSA